MERREQAKVQNETRFWNTYVKALDGLGNEYGLNPDQVQEMIKGIASKNQKTHPDPLVAAQINFHREYVGILKRQAEPKKTDVPVHGKPPISATGIATTQKTDEAKPETISVDADTRKIMSAFGLNDEFMKKVHKDINKGV